MRRRSPRAVLLWMSAVLVAVVTGVIVATDLAALHRRAQSLGPPRQIAAAVRDLPIGTTIADDDIRVRSVHRSQLPADAMSAGAARGRVVAVPVVRGAFVTGGNLAPRRRTGLNGAIPPGMRALRLVVPDALRPPVGSSVDVLVTFEPGNTPESAGAPTVVAARGVLVLGTDDAPPAFETGATEPSGSGSTGGPLTALGVTLLVTEDDAPRLAFATATGVVTIALVPPEDARPVVTR
jgi:Flp pilus assembly protein CpaB